MAQVKSMVIGAVEIQSQIVKSGGEYRVQVRQAGAKWAVACDYFTDDRKDAEGTQVRMMHDYREQLNHAANRTGA